MLERMILQGVCAIVYALEITGLLFVSQKKYEEKYYVKVKMMCSSSFLVIGVIFACVSSHWKYFLLLLPALAFCALGDFFMGCYKVKRKRRDLTMGLVFFLLAHIGFLVALYMINPILTWWNVILPLIVLALLLLQRSMLKMHYGKMILPVCIYSVFLALMLAASTQYMVMEPNIASCWIGMGGILFFISDYMINFIYFYKIKDEKRDRVVKYVNLTTYYFGILGFLMSVLYY